MNHKEKQSITHYISIRFAAIILIMAAIMILFISYFSNKTIYFDIRRQIRRESRYDFLNDEVIGQINAHFMRVCGLFNCMVRQEYDKITCLKGLK